MRLHVPGRAVAALLAGPALSACVVVGGGLPLAHDTQVETRAFEPGGLFTLENVNGRVTVATWSEPRVRIEADKAASAESLLRGMRIEIAGEGLRVDVPDGAGGRLEAATVNGSIQSDLTLESTGRATRRRLQGRLGKGRGSLELSTVNGSIHLRRS